MLASDCSRRFFFGAWVAIAVSVSGCAVAKATGRTVGTVGYHTARLTGKTALAAAKVTGKGAATVVNMASGTQVVPLERAGGLFAEVTLNRRIKARMMVDTGAGEMQISQELARRLRINLSRAERTQVRVAGGQLVPARMVYLKEVRIGRARVRNVRAIVIDREGAMGYDGLLGMGFLNHFVFQVDTQRARLILKKRT